MGGGGSKVEVEEEEQPEQAQAEKVEALCRLQIKTEELRLQTLEIQLRKEQQMFSHELEKELLTKKYEISIDFQNKIFGTLEKLEKSEKNYSAAEIGQIITALGAVCGSICDLNFVKKVVSAVEANMESKDHDATGDPGNGIGRGDQDEKLAEDDPIGRMNSGSLYDSDDKKGTAMSTLSSSD